MAITYWEGTDASGNYTDSKTEISSQNAIGDMWTVSEPDSYSNSDGKFFVNWSIVSSGNANSVYPIGASCNYEEFEKALDLYAQYTNDISVDGSYTLIAGTTYHLNNVSSWSVGDGYVYNGDRNFCVASNGNYSFKQEAKPE